MSHNHTEWATTGCRQTTDPREWARRLARNIVFHALIEGAAKGCLIGMLLAGCILLPLRQGLHIPPMDLWPLAGLPFFMALAGAARAFRRNRFDRDSAAALLDARLHYGGLLVSRDISGWDEWGRNLSPPGQIVVRFKNRRLWMTLVLSGLFALAAGFWPDPPPQATADGRMELGADIERLREQAALLAETQPDDLHVARKFLEQLERLAGEMNANDPAEIWDTLDIVSARLRDSAAEAAEAAMHDIQQLESLLSMAAMSSRIAAHTPASPVLTGALSQLAAELMDRLSDQDFALTDAMQEALLRAMNGELPDLSALQSLCDRLLGDIENMAAILDQWADAKLIDADTVAFCLDSVQAAILAELQNDKVCFAGDACQAGGEGCEGESVCLPALAGLVGAGGIGRGPGPAPMIFGDPTAEEGAGYARLPVAPAWVALSAPTTLEGFSLVAPGADPKAPTDSRTPWPGRRRRRGGPPYTDSPPAPARGHGVL